MLPGAEQAFIEEAKVRDYLLSSTHPIGRFKSVVFEALGYTHENWPLLAADLLSLARRGLAISGQTSPYGDKYEVSGTLQGPNGRTARFTTVWLVRPEGGFPRFVTAFPG
jgi:hypothetical protein